MRVGVRRRYRYGPTLLGMIASVSAAQEPPARPAGEGDDIVVQARNDAGRRRYVERVARPEPGRQLARWTRPLCIKYDGLDGTFARFIHARIVETAASVKVRVAAQGCQASTLVKLTDRADAIAKELAHMQPPRLGSVTSGQLPSPSLIAAIEAPHVVRWLTASATVNHDGVPITDDKNALWSSSLIRSSTREDVSSKIILIDAVRLANVSLNQLADYVAFVTLGSPDMAADFSGTDSIMTLFTGSAAPARMTRLDRLFLAALYAAPADRPARVQKSAIRARIADAERAGRAD